MMKLFFVCLLILVSPFTLPQTAAQEKAVEKSLLEKAVRDDLPAKEATAKYGVGPAAVRSIAGTMDLHVQLEQRLAKFKGAEDVITFQSGFTVNL